MSHTQASPLWWAASRENKRRRTGSASALNMLAMRSASALESSAAPRGGQGKSTALSAMSSAGIVIGQYSLAPAVACYRSRHNVTSPIPMNPVGVPVLMGNYLEPFAESVTCRDGTPAKSRALPHQSQEFESLRTRDGQVGGQ